MRYQLPLQEDMDTSEVVEEAEEMANGDETIVKEEVCQHESHLLSARAFLQLKCQFLVRWLVVHLPL